MAAEPDDTYANPGSLVRLGSDGHSLEGLIENWRKQAESHGEEFDQSAYPVGLFEPLEAAGRPQAGVFALHYGGEYLAACQLNSAYIPGYQNRVMRLRHLTISPTLELTDQSVDQYGLVLFDVLSGVINLCLDNGPMRSPHLKFHLPSPADRQYFATIGRNLASRKVFASVEARGAWLYMDINYGGA